MYRIKTFVKVPVFLFMGMILFACNNIGAGDLRKVVSLNGKWKFSIGDNKDWSNPGFDDSSWDEIIVPARWEDQGYNDYNGYAWYRRTFTMPQISSNEPIYLKLGRIDDVSELYLNGKLINITGSFPPNYLTAYNQQRQSIIPRELLRVDAENTIAVKVYDSYLEGGIVAGPVGIYIDEDNNFLDLAITGKWRFHLGDNKLWADPKFDDIKWTSVEVPREWESQGFQDYDGYAWYRKNFKVPAGFNDGNLYLSLGKIDDYDYVYLNGKLIGCVFDLKHDSQYKRKGYEYNARRIYKIPTGLLKENSVNTISVRVYDEQWRGGIYEGPIGIMKEQNYKRYQNKNYSNQSFWDYIIDEFIIDYQ